MKRNVGLLIVAAGVALVWFIGFTDDGQALGRDFILWLRSIGNVD